MLVCRLAAASMWHTLHGIVESAPAPCCADFGHPAGTDIAAAVIGVAILDCAR